MIRAVIFDCFGVLTSDGWLPFKKKHFSHDKELMQQATDLNKQSDAGMLGYKEYLSEVAGLAGTSVEETRRAIEDNVADEELFDYIKTELKPRYKLGLLSNAAGNWLDELFSPEQVQLFDAVALSYDTGYLKPDERAFTTIADRLDVPVEDCVLIDDQERYCTGARDIGMQAIVYKNFEQMKQDLGKLLSNPKD